MSPTSYHLLYSAIYDTHAVSRCLIIIPQHGVCVNRFYQKSLCNFSREFTRLSAFVSDNALAHHGGGDLLETGDVGTGDQVALHAVLFGSGGSTVIDVDHDVV